jgi:hypothetical protein
VTPEEEQQMEEHLASFFMNSLDALTGPDGFYNLQQKIHQTTFKPVSAGYYYDFADKADANSGDPTEIVSYPSPRYYAPSIPSLSILNSRGSTRHGGDGIYTDDGTLQCRFSGQCITGSNAYQSNIFDEIDDSQQFANFSPIPTVNIPVDCSGLFRELLILSFTRANCFSWRGPRMASDLNESWKWWDNLGSEAMNFLQHYICGGDDLFRQCLIAHDKETYQADILKELTGSSQYVEQAEDVDGNGLLNWNCLGDWHPDIRFTGGVLPSPVANNLWSQAWVPMYLDYKIGYCHNVNPTDWKLDSEYTRDLNADMFLNSVDYEYMDAAPDPIFGDASEPYGNFPRIVERTPLTRGPGLIASDKLKRVLDDENDLDTLNKGLLEENDEVTLENLKDDLAWMDVLSATLSGFKPLVYSMAGSEGMRGGHGRIEEAVIVDAFGRTQTLFQPTNTQSPHLLSLSMGCGDRVYSNEPSWSTPFTLRPRIVQGARVMFRFLSSTDDDQPSNAESDGQNSPVCAFFLPDHVEWSMEVFDSEGSPQGQLRVAERDWTQGGVQSGRLAWDTAPGKPIALGTQPQSCNIHSDALLNQLILSGLDDELDPTREEGVLSALLRAIDTTRWDIDRFGTSGNEHLATFMGHPIAVVRAKVRLEVDERGDGTTSEELLRRIFQIRVGALGKVSDGLLGYFMNDDYTKFHAVYPVHETTGGAVPMEPYQQDLNSENPDIIPLTHPFLYFDPTIELRPNQEVTLTLLMNPLAAVHASSGVLPQKEIKMTRNHFDSALSKIAPTFKIGPVLVDPGSIRMPLPNQGNIAWSWGFKENYSSWLDEDVEDADQSAKLRKGRLKAWEGWLKLDPIEESD